MEISRDKKRLIIIGVYIVIFFLFGWIIYSWLKPDPTCSDGKQNQGEKQVDCGGPCSPCEKTYSVQDLIVGEKTFVLGGQGKYDVMMKVINPNNQVGVKNFSYRFVLKDGNGNILAERTGRSFILPIESKYVIETDLESGVAPDSVEASVSSPEWEEFLDYERPEINIYNKRYELVSSGVGYSEAKGLLRNESPFDFDLIKINVVLRDETGKSVAFNKTEMRTINSGEERDFRLLWPVNFPGSVQAVEMGAEVDVFNSETFLKKYTKETKPFQQNN